MVKILEADPGASSKRNHMVQNRSTSKLAQEEGFTRRVQLLLSVCDANTRLMPFLDGEVMGRPLKKMSNLVAKEGWLRLDCQSILGDYTR